MTRKCTGEIQIDKNELIDNYQNKNTIQHSKTKQVKMLAFRYFRRLQINKEKRKIENIQGKFRTYTNIGLVDIYLL